MKQRSENTRNVMNILSANEPRIYLHVEPFISECAHMRVFYGYLGTHGPKRLRIQAFRLI